VNEQAPEPYRAPDQAGWPGQPHMPSTPYEPPAPYGAPPPYGTPGGWGMAPRDHPSGTTVLVLGILSLVICPITGIFAITIGNRSLREIDANPLAYANRQSVVIGRILGIVSVAIYGVAIVGYLVFVVAIAGVVGLSGR